MANTLRFKRGLASGIPTALAGEPLFTTDTFDLYIGNGTTNTRFQKYIASGTTSQLLRGDGSLLTMPIVLTSPATGQVLKFNGTNWVNDSDAGITGSGSAGQVAYFTGATTQGGSNNLFWDAANGRLGIFTTTPSARFHIIGSSISTAIFASPETFGGIDIRNTDTLANTRTSQIRLVNGTTFFGANDRSYQLVNVGTSATVSDFYVQYWNGTSYFDRFRVFGNTGNFGIGTGATDSGQKLQVIGTGYFSDSVGIGSTSLTGYNLRISNNITGIVSPNVVRVDGTIQGTATGATQVYISIPSLAASAAISEIRHYSAVQGTYGAGSSILTQTGFFVHSNHISGATNYAFYGDIPSGTNRWNLYMNGTARNFLSGDTLIGSSTISAGNEKLQVTGTARFTDTIKLKNGTTSSLALTFNAATTTGIYNFDDGVGANMILQASGQDNQLVLHRTGNILVGSGTNSGEKLQVNGTAKITGATAINAALTITNATLPSFKVNHTAAGHASGWFDTNEFGVLISSASTSASHYLTNMTSGGTSRFRVNCDGGVIMSGNLTVDTNTLFVDATNKRVGISATPLYKLHVRPVANANFGVRNAADFNASFTGTAIGSFNDANNANTNLYLESSQLGLNLQSAQNVLVGGNLGIAMTPSYKLDVSGSARVSDAIAIGTTPDTNNPFKILKNINATVGIKFENTNTSSLAFSAVQLGTDVSGGTKFTNLVYASSGVTASGVYNPDGTSLINNGNGGLNFLGNPIRMYTGGSNGVLRWDISNEGIIQYNATSPTTSAADAYKQYSADVTAGNAAPHFRTENGAVIKLYQETTAVGNSIISLGGGNAVLDDTTFDGYTLRQIVKALRNQGILA